LISQHSKIGEYRSILYTLYDEFETLYPTIQRDYFFISTSEIKKRLHQRYNVQRTTQNISKIISYLTLVGLIEKLPDNEITDKKLLEKSYKKARNKNKSHRITYYRIPEYTREYKGVIRNNLKIIKENKISVTKMKYEYLLHLFGVDTANKIYPTFQNRDKVALPWAISPRIKQQREDKASIVEDIFCLLMAKKEHTSKNEIINQMLKLGNWSEWSYQIWLDTYLDGLINNYGFVESWINKEIRNRYNLPQSQKGKIIHYIGSN